MKKIIIISHFAAKRKSVGSNRINDTFKYINEFKKILITPRSYKCEISGNYWEKSFDIIDYCLNIDPDSIRRTIKILLEKFKKNNSEKKNLDGNNRINNNKNSTSDNKANYPIIKSVIKIFNSKFYLNLINFIDIYKFNIPFIFIKLLKHARDKDTILFVSGKPFSYLIPCYFYKNIFSNKIIFDLRDDWEIGEFINSSLLSKLELKIKTTLLKNCDIIVTVSDPIKMALEKWTDKPVYVVTNGFDGDIELSKDLNFNSSRKINIGYFGNLYYYAGENLMLNCIKELEMSDKIQIDFFGKVNPESKFHKLDFVRAYNMVSRHELIGKMRDYHYLFLLLPYDSYRIGVFSGKIFDYIQSGVPILALITKKGNEPAVQLITETKSGIVVDPDDRENILTVLNNLDNQSFIKEFYKPQLNVIQQYSREKLAKKLEQILSMISC